MGAAQVMGGRLGAYRRWSQVSLDPETRRAATAKARATFEARFADAPDPVAARKAYYVGIRLQRGRRANRKKAA